MVRERHSFDCAAFVLRGLAGATNRVEYGAMASESESNPILSRVALFSGLSENERRAITSRIVRQHADAGTLIFNEGDACQGLFIVEAGAVKIFKTSASGREQVLAIEGPGGLIAELPVFDDGPYPASASATVDATLLFLSKRDFRSLCVEHPEIGLKVLKAVGQRLRRLVALIEELSFTTVRHRLASLLMRLARTQGRATPRGIELVLPSNQELGNQIGTVRELVSRNLSRFQAEGAIRMDGKQVLITDIEALEAELEAM
jgi:CRP/FNR family transcriptional regulator